METIHVHSKIQSYDIILSDQLRFQIKDYLSKDYSSIFIITDTNVFDIYGKDVLENFRHTKVFIEVINAGEESKNIKTYYHLQSKAIEYGLDRKSLIIALGGGVVGDLAGFVAATYMRGIDYIQMPTTILAHDSSVGGKVAINHEKGKNLIGSFYPPRLVLYDTETLRSLPEREIRSGYAELIKESFLADKDFLEQLLTSPLHSLPVESLTDFLAKGIKIKASIVQEDEKESGKRMFLNLGHTLAHALETKLGYGVITHGEAVAIGLLFALYVSERELDAQLPRTTLKNWLEQNQYPFQLVNEIDDLVELMKHDKKSIDRQIQMVLLKQVAQPVIHPIDEENLKRYLQQFIHIEMRKDVS